MGFIAVMYFLIIRPQNKRIKSQQEMIANLSCWRRDHFFWRDWFAPYLKYLMIS
ncbi:MAG: preprotein translocase subunit YajC [Gammaproteobacteria bacterium]